MLLTVVIANETRVCSCLGINDWMIVGRQFDLFSTSYFIGDTYADSDDDPEEAGADQILARLRILRSYQESARDEELYQIFSFDPRNAETPGEDLVTNEVAAAVVEFFHHEASAGRRWESLNFNEEDTSSTEPFGRMLEGARSSGLFLSCQVFRKYQRDDLQLTEERILRQFCQGNSSLERLWWFGPVWSPAILWALIETLHHVSCGITHLTIIPSKGVPPVGLIDVLEAGCHSLESLRLEGRCINLPDQVYRILNLVNTCPNLREIDLSRCALTEGTMWGRLTPDHCSLDARKRFHRLCLPFFHVDQRCDQCFNELLQAFPVLGDFGRGHDSMMWWKPTEEESMVFSLRT